MILLNAMDMGSKAFHTFRVREKSGMSEFQKCLLQDMSKRGVLICFLGGHPLLNFSLVCLTSLQ